ncbi:MAG: type III pantothenate kinase, partial [Flavobacteriales bacterium]|nr:type III pantothenate kinase [Flavobacteriales bacterium]
LKLTIDQGNTTVKVALFEEEKLLQKISEVDFEAVLKYAKDADRVILSSVKSKSEYLNLNLSHSYFIYLDSKTPLPIENRYSTLNTLGKDRIALSVGAHHLFPHKDVLILDMGTCLTYDFINAEGQYLGGGISPGLFMRFKALYHFTDGLPMVSPKDSPSLIGDTTGTSILSGVINGMSSEIDGIIQRYTIKYPNINIIITGGDANFFDKGLKNTIFASSDLLMIGLNKILDYNEAYF